LKSLKSTNEERQEMRNILQRVKDTEDYQTARIDLSNKLDKLDLNDPHFFEKLSKEDQENFTKLLARNEWGSILELWKPWWTKPPKISIISEGNHDIEDEEDDAELSTTPTIPDLIPPLDSIYKREPSPDMLFNLIDILYCYVFCQRIYDGNPFTDIAEYVATFFNLSSVIFQNKTFSDMNIVSSTLLDNVIKTKERYPYSFLLSLFEDVEKITSLKIYTVTAVYDIYLTLTYFSDNFQNYSKEMHDLVKKNQVEAAKKKLYFYFLWSNQVEEHKLAYINLEVRNELTEKTQFFETNEKKCITTANNGKKLVQEILK